MEFIELKDIKQDINTFVCMMKQILNVDLIVVDNHLNSLVNTFEYEKKPIDVQLNSVVGNVIVTGQIKVVKDKGQFKECVNCPQFKECEIASIIGVPINIQSGCIGAVALLIKKKDENEYLWSFDNALDYLKQIAELLANKIQNNVYKQQIFKSSALFKITFGYIKEAVALVDEQKRVTFSNKRFCNFFSDGKDAQGRNIEELMDEKCDTHSAGGQDYGFGAVFSKFGEGSMQLSLLQKIETFDNQETYLYVFENINISYLRKKQAKIYNLKKWIEAFFGVSQPMCLAKEAAMQAAENALSVTIEGPYKFQNDELAKMYLLKSAVDGEGILEIECSRDRRVLEQELFGVGKNFKGILDLTKGKTICLYSIERMPLYLQNKIADYLLINQMQGQYGTNIRMIVTSEKALAELMGKRLFSDKLYYYISRNKIQIPLLEKKEDIIYFFEKYIKHYGSIYQRFEIKVREEVWDYLEKCFWEDGSNQIQQFVELLVMNLNGNIITVDTIKMIQIQYGLMNMGGIEDENEQKIREMLLYSGKSKKEIAEELKIGRATLYRWLKKYNL